jgi:peptide/nickel transport system ATP-binding protein
MNENPPLNDDSCLLEFHDFSLSLRRDGTRLLHKINFKMQKGEIVGLIGESGCGKSLLATSVLRLLPQKTFSSEGEIRFLGKNLCALPEKELIALRGKDAAIVFQEPLSALNPVLNIKDQLCEIIRLHRKISRAELNALAISQLRLAAVPDPERVLRSFPHELSGGLRQRVLLAMATANRPALLLADEPTTALDTTVQAQILDLLLVLREHSGSGILLITHDLGVVAEICDRAMVMYAGQIVEEAPCEALLTAPAHRYAKGLLESLPEMSAGQERLSAIPGQVPVAEEYNWQGCGFYSRCSCAQDICQNEMPPLKALSAERKARCHYPLI